MTSPFRSGRSRIENALVAVERLRSSNLANVDWQAKVLDEYHHKTMGPLAVAQTGKLPRQRSFEILQECARLIEAEMAAICKPHSADVWLSYVRRLPSLVLNWEEDWAACATLAIIKHSNWAESTVTAEAEVAGITAIRVQADNMTIEDAGRIALLSRALALITSDCRWIGKGAAINHAGGGKYSLSIPADVEEAVKLYEERRPGTPPWHEIGIVPAAVATGEPVIATLMIDRQIADVRRMDISIPTVYRMELRQESEIADILDPYKKAVEAEYGVTLPAIMHTMVSICNRLRVQLPVWTRDTKYEFRQTPEDELFASSLDHFLKVHQLGLVSLPEQALKESLSAWPRPPWSTTLDEAREHVESFFQAFLLTPERRGQIDVVRRQPFYRFLFTTPVGSCYVDLHAMAEFYRELVLGARDWVAKAHGDNFSLDVRRLASRINGVTPLPKIKGFRYDSGHQGEIDVPLLIGRRLYATECKAYSKSAALMAGDPEATNGRNQDVNSWVEQAKKATETFWEQRADVEPKLPDGIEEVQWVVCTPGQEYVRPAGKFGYLGTLPRVCSVAEFLEHLQSEAARVGFKTV